MCPKNKKNKRLMAHKRAEIKASLKKGLPPGSLVYLGLENDTQPVLQHLKFNPNECSETSLDINTFQVKTISEEGWVNWIQLIGIHDAGYVGKIGERFGFDNLVLEDILNTEHRPSFEEMENHLFISMKIFEYTPDNMDLCTRQFSMILGPHHVISFHESDIDFFNALTNRIKTSGGRIRQKSNDYLFYALLDIVVDSYYETVEKIEEVLEKIEDEVNNSPSQEIPVQIELHRKHLLRMRRMIYPFRDALVKITRDDIDLIDDVNEKYFRDVYEHSLHVLENIDNLLENCISIKDLYMSNMSMKMNKVIQILTIYTLIFSPITFIAGLYGMNFEFMPELHVRYGYFYVIGIMILIVTVMLAFFKRKKWL
jgi:magnesium transporter